MAVQDRQRRYRYVGLIVILGICVIGAIGVIARDSLEEPTKRSYRIGVLLYNQEDVFISNTWERMCYYLEEVNSKGTISLEAIVFDGVGSQSVQKAQMNQLVKEGYDVVVANTVEREDAASISDKAKEAKMPLVFFNREPVPYDMQKWEKSYYVGSRAEQAGALQGELLVEAMQAGLIIDKNNDGKIQYVMLEGEYGHQDAILRSYHCIRTLESQGYTMENLATDTAMWRRGLGQEKMLEWLTVFEEKIELVIANNDEMALGAVDALKVNGYFQEEKWMPVIGVDGIEEACIAIEEGYMLGTVLNNSDEQAKVIVAKIYEMLTGDKTILAVKTEESNKYFWVEHRKITKESLESVKNITK